MYFWGQTLALVVASSQLAAQRAAAAVKGLANVVVVLVLVFLSFCFLVSYVADHAVLSLEQAIAEGSEHNWAADDSMAQVEWHSIAFLCSLICLSKHLHHGDVTALLQQQQQQLQRFEGSVNLAASDHLYLEPHSSTVVPCEDATELLVSATTQNLAGLVG